MEEFISRNKGVHEAGVILVAHEAEEVDVVHTLEQHQFVSSDSMTTDKVLDILAEGAYVFFTTQQLIENPALYFDIVEGYASGSIRIGTQNINPKYSSNNFVLVLRADFVTAELEEGRDWLSICGMVFSYTNEK